MQPELWPADASKRNPDGLGMDIAEQTLVFRRGDPHTGRSLVVALNFSQAQCTVDVSGVADGAWQDLLTGPGGFGDTWSCIATDREDHRAGRQQLGTHPRAYDGRTGRIGAYR